MQRHLRAYAVSVGRLSEGSAEERLGGGASRLLEGKHLPFPERSLQEHYESTEDQDRAEDCRNDPADKQSDGQHCER